MEKNSTVKNVQSNGTFDFNGKTFYKYEVEMANGDVGEYNSISQDQNHFIIGATVDYIYDVTKPQYPKIKPVYNFNASPSRNGNLKNTQKAAAGDNVQLMIVKQSCLKAAVELVGPNSQFANVAEVTKIAQFFVNWVMNNDSKIPENYSKKIILEEPEKERTDLPF